MTDEALAAAQWLLDALHDLQDKDLSPIERKAIVVARELLAAAEASSSPMVGAPVTITNFILREPGNTIVCETTRPPPADGWRTMDSAPRDATSILVSGHLIRGDRYVDTCCFWDGKWSIMEGYGEPTHWQPLPGPPAQEKGDG